MGESTASARYAAEFVGTFCLVFTIGCNIATHQSNWGGVSIASVLVVMIYALGKSSGAHFNPAVSVACGVAGKMVWKEVMCYSVIQTISGIVAGFAYVAMFGESMNLRVVNNTIGAASGQFEIVKDLAPTKGHTALQACFAEFFYTFMLCFVVLNVAASKLHAGKNQFYGLAIGFVIVAGAYSGGAISMGCFNPAVAIGLDVSSIDKGVKICLLYCAVELAAGVAAAFAFLFCRPEESVDGSGPEHETPLKAKLLSEFLGTYMLTLTVGLNVLNGSHAAAFSVAAALMCMIFALGTVSGAHFNPAVTLAIICSGRGKCSVSDGLKYVGVQTLAAVTAAFTYTLMMGGKTFGVLPANATWHRVVLAEFVFTFILAFVVLSVATVNSPLSEYFGLAIGFCITAGGFAIGQISSGILNPALAIGIEAAHLIAAPSMFWHCILYTAAELAAGAAAAGIFMITQPSEYSEKLNSVETSYGSTSQQA